MQIRGLVNFIGDIRNCKTEEEEVSRIDKELAKIRASFSKPNVGSYAKRKYMWKIMYMYTLGYTVEFGHMQCVDLIRSETYSEKNVGYVGVSLLLIEHTDMLRMCINTIRNDLKSRNEIFQCLALTCVANVGGPEFAESLVPDVQSLLISGTSRTFVRKKAALCLLRLLRQYPENCPSETVAAQIIKLAEHRNVGVVTSVLSLLTGLATYDSANYAPVVSVAIKLLHQFVINRECSKEYIYYRTPCPWLQVKLLRILQYYPPPADQNEVIQLQDILERIVSKTEVTQSVNKNHADHSILFEAMNVIIHLNLHGEDMLHDRAIQKLLHFINVKEGNIRYLGLDAMARLARVAGTHKLIKRHLRTIQYSLEDSDISIRKRALDLLYSICDEDNVVEILEHLLRYLTKAEFGIREEMVLKIAILAEKFATDYQWYIDVILKLLTIAGDYVSEDVWHRVVQIVTNQESLQAYAAGKVFESLQSPIVHESLIKVGGYILGEFGHLLEQNQATGIEQFECLNRHFQSASPPTKALLLSTYMKFVNMYEELNDQIMDIFKAHHNSVDAEIQQRAVEYSVMVTYKDQELVSQVWEAMPDFPEREESNLMKIVKSKAEKKFGEALSNSERKDDDESGDSEEEGDTDDDDESESESEGEEPVKSNGYTKKAIKTETVVVPTPGQSNNETDFIGDLFNTNNIETRMGDNTKFMKAITTGSCVLYEDKMMQIGIKSQVDIPGAIMKIILYYGNKTPNELSITSVSLNTSVSDISMDFAPSTLTIASKQQGQQKCKAVVMSPMDSVPMLDIKVNVGGKLFLIKLQFPIIANKFFVPHVFEPAQFPERWQKLGSEEQKVFQLVEKRDANQLKSIISQGLNMGLIMGVDNNPNNCVACAVYHFSKRKADGNYVSMPILLRMEYNSQSNSTRITIRSPHEKTSRSVMLVFEKLFVQPPPATTSFF